LAACGSEVNASPWLAHRITFSAKTGVAVRATVATANAIFDRNLVVVVVIPFYNIQAFLG